MGRHLTNGKVAPVEASALSVGALADATGVSTRSLRYYEEQGLLVPDRNSAGHRRYSSRSVDCVRFIQSLYAAGIPSTLIREIARDWDRPGGMARIEVVLAARHAELLAGISAQQAAVSHLKETMSIVRARRDAGESAPIKGLHFTPA